MTATGMVGLADLLGSDRALAGRFIVTDEGAVRLTGPDHGDPPTSQKERRRWELHVRTRVAATWGADAAESLSVHF